MKKNKLYTANKWNRPAFMPKEENIFWPGGVVITGSNNAIYQRARNDLSNSIQGSFNPNAMPNISVPTNQGVNTQSQQQIQPQQAGLMDSSLSFLASPYGAMANGIGAVAGKALSGNKKSIFSGWTGGLAQATQGIPVVGGFMSIADGVMNALYGEEQADLDMGKINDITAKNQQAAQGATTISNTMDYKSFADAINNVNYASTSTRGSDIDNNDTAEGRRIARELNENAQAANDLIAHNIDFASNNIARNMSNNAAKNFVYALGGPLFAGGGALDYGLAMNYLTMKKQQSEAKNRVPDISPMPAINTFGHGGYFNPFALGGDVQTEEEKNKEANEAMLDLIHYFNMRQKYPDGRKKSSVESFLNYGLGIPERKTEPYFSPVEIFPFAPNSPINSVEQILNTGRKVIKSIGSGTKKTVSEGRPYVPHIRFANGGQMYSIGKTYDVSEEEANRLKAMGYEFTVVS